MPARPQFVAAEVALAAVGDLGVDLERVPEAELPVLEPRLLGEVLVEQLRRRDRVGGLDGVVAKPLDQPYAPGKRTLFKIKHGKQERYLKDEGELQEFLLEVCKHRLIALFVDDLQAVDEESQALLSVLARLRSRFGFTLVATIWFAGVCHALNLLDNMDGLAAGGDQRRNGPGRRAAAWCRSP